MCGIGGFFSKFESCSVDQLEKMAEKMRHRGPDARGFKQFNQGAILHTRLSIIDLETGAQPMSDETQKYWITYNGEIYNYKLIRSELMNFGFQFKTNSDTEVLLAAYKKWGKLMLSKLRGMFAFAIVDLNENLVFCARDHFGIKPFFYFFGKEVFCFSSELNSLRCCLPLSPTINLDSIENYLRFQYIPSPKTIFNEIEKLPPAHYIVYHFSGNLELPTLYWNLKFDNNKRLSDAEWIEKAEHVIEDSVKNHLIADVDYGAFLSGGIDSTLVVRAMVKNLNRKVKTFSIGYNETNFSEIDFVKTAVNKFQTESYLDFLSADSTKILTDLVNHFGEPFGDSSAIPTFFVSRLAARHVKMILSGDGGDEAFGGYSSYQNWIRFQGVNYRVGWKKKLFPLANLIFPSRFSSFNSLNDWVEQVEVMQPEFRSKIWRNEFHQKTGLTAPAIFSRCFNEKNNSDLLQKVQWTDANTYMTSDILAKVDVTSMVHSLEVRTPLIDKNVWEFAATLPHHLKLRSLTNQKTEGKFILKQLLRKDFTDDFIYRTKRGFSIPIANWFQPGSYLYQLLFDKVVSAGSSVSNFFNVDFINELYKQKRYSNLWQIIFLNEWLELNDFNSKK